jgi:predicted RNA-binding protein Jag
MKSMLHEASTVLKAMEKAWVESGKPLEFSITVLEVGEKNFLGLTKRPAIVSITYDPRKQTEKVVEKKERETFPPRQQQTRSAAQPQRASRNDGRNDIRQGRIQQSPDRLSPQPTQLRQPQQQRPVQPVQPVREEQEHWTAEMVADVKAWANELLPLLSINVPFECKIDKRALLIAFENNIFETPEEDRQLFVGLSYLIIQFLKKKHKKKFRGYHLVLSTKQHATSDKSRSSSSHS